MYNFKAEKKSADCNDQVPGETAEFFKAERDLKFMYKHSQKIAISDGENAVLCAMQGAKVLFKDVDDVWRDETDIVERKGNVVHWEDIITVNDMLSGRLMIREDKFEDNIN